MVTGVLDKTMARFSLSGSTLGKYHILEALGHGGMAQVYRAYHPQMDRYVAIKLMRPDLMDEDSFVARFQREAQAVGRLRHPHIVQVFDFDVADDMYYMVMELLNGQTLKTYLSRQAAQAQTLPWGTCLRIALDVLAGLAYAHQAGMIHRDIKPANIMLTSEGQAVIVDFGITQIVGSTRHTVSGALMGTINYMAPEQGWAEQSDARSDIYSLGIVLYEMLTRQTPFDGDTPLATLMKHLNDPLPSPRELEPSIPLVLEEVILKALAKAPEARYQSAEAMQAAVLEAAEAADILIPNRLDLDLETEVPEQVFSGTDRAALTGSILAQENTEITHIPQSQPARLAENQALIKVEPLVPITPLEPVSDLATSTGLSLFYLLGFFSIYNLFLIIFAGLVGNVGDLWRALPVLFTWIAYGLFKLMHWHKNIWLLIPANILLGNGMLFSYYTLSGNWSNWAFLWPLEPLLVIGSLMLTIRLANRSPEKQARSAERFSKKLGRWSLIFSLITPIMAVVL